MVGTIRVIAVGATAGAVNAGVEAATGGTEFSIIADGLIGFVIAVFIIVYLARKA